MYYFNCRTNQIMHKALSRQRVLLMYIELIHFFLLMCPLISTVNEDIFVEDFIDDVEGICARHVYHNITKNHDMYEKFWSLCLPKHIYQFSLHIYKQCIYIYVSVFTSEYQFQSKKKKIKYK